MACVCVFVCLLVLVVDDVGVGRARGEAPCAALVVWSTRSLVCHLYASGVCVLTVIAVSCATIPC